MPIRTERHAHILTVTIDRPEVRNAFNAETAQQMNDAMDVIDNDPDIFAAIITGAGGTFSAGADLKAAARHGTSGAVAARGPFGLCRQPPTKPLIAAVEGFALGGGFEIVLSCDLVVAAEDARLGLPEVKWNLAALGGGLLRLPRRIPYHLAMEIALSGEPRPAAFFHAHGLVNRLTKPGEALAQAQGMARALLRNGPTALAATVAIMRRAGEWDEQAGWDAQRPLAARALTSADRAEGVRAFAEKRDPVWTGR